MRKGGWIGIGVAVLAVALLAARGRGLRAAPARDDGAAPDLRPGDACTVYLRGDASGTAFHDRIPALGLLVTFRGSFEHQDAQWVRIRDGSRHFQIPRSSIAAIEFDGGKGEKPETSEPAKPDDGGRPKLDLR